MNNQLCECGEINCVLNRVEFEEPDIQEYEDDGFEEEPKIFDPEIQEWIYLDQLM